MLVLLANLYYLQVESYETYQTRSNDNRIRVVPVAPPVASSTTPTVSCWRKTARSQPGDRARRDREPEKTADDLITLLALPEGTKEKFLAEVKRQRRFKPVPCSRS